MPVDIPGKERGQTAHVEARPSEAQNHVYQEPVIPLRIHMARHRMADDSSPSRSGAPVEDVEYTGRKGADRCSGQDIGGIVTACFDAFKSRKSGEGKGGCPQEEAGVPIDEGGSRK